MKVTATYDFEINNADMEKAVEKAVKNHLANNPDFVQVVRCKDCDHASFVAWCSKYECGKIDGLVVFSDDYCSFGRRADE